RFGRCQLHVGPQAVQRALIERIHEIRATELIGDVLEGPAIPEKAGCGDGADSSNARHSVGPVTDQGDVIAPLDRMHPVTFGDDRGGYPPLVSTPRGVPLSYAIGH